MEFAGQTAIVTGAARGFGRAIALPLAAEGAAVAVTGNTPAKVEVTAAALKDAKATFHAAALDLSTPETVERFFAEVQAKLGPTDILVNATAWRIRQSFLETTYADWRKTFAVCVDRYFYCSLAAARQMVPRKWGRIIHTGSIAGAVMMAPFAAYTAAKGAVHALAKAMAVDLMPQGITVNVMAPGAAETEYLRKNVTPAAIEKRLERIPAGRNRGRS